MTTKLFTQDDLEALDLGELRRLFSKSTGLGCGVRKPSTLIKAIIAAQTKANDGSDTEGEEPELVVDSDTLDAENGNQDGEVAVDTDTQATVDTEDSEHEVAVDTATGDTGTDDASQEAEVVDDEATMVDTAAIATEPEVTTATSQEPVAPIKVKVVGTGNNTGSTLVCDLASRTGSVATVSVLGKEIRFRVEDGIPTRVPKAWGSGGWQLDIESLPPVVEPTVAEMVQMRSRDLTIEQLQQVFEHLSGRETTSTTRVYLCNQVRLAMAGTLPQGTRRIRSGEPQKVVPVAMPVATVEKLDAAWRRNGYGSRIAFIRTALSEKLLAEGEDEVAKLVLR